jgi:hypothetical protein
MTADENSETEMILASEGDADLTPLKQPVPVKNVNKQEKCDGPADRND